MSPETETLRLQLEEVGARHWWAALLASLSSQSGNAYMRFVGVVDGRARYRGAAFPVPRLWGTVPPQDQWAPGMDDSLAEIQHRIEGDGWRPVDHGAQPWEVTYQRPSTPGASR